MTEVNKKTDTTHKTKFPKTDYRGKATAAKPGGKKEEIEFLRKTIHAKEVEQQSQIKELMSSIITDFAEVSLDEKAEPSFSILDSDEKTPMKRLFNDDQKTTVVKFPLANTGLSIGYCLKTVVHSADHERGYNSYSELDVRSFRFDSEDGTLFVYPKNGAPCLGTDEKDGRGLIGKSNREDPLFPFWNEPGHDYPRGHEDWFVPGDLAFRESNTGKLLKLNGDEALAKKFYQLIMDKMKILNTGFQRIKDRETADKQSQREVELAAKLEQQMKGLDNENSRISELVDRVKKKQ